MGFVAIISTLIGILVGFTLGCIASHLHP